MHLASLLSAGLVEDVAVICGQMLSETRIVATARYAASRCAKTRLDQSPMAFLAGPHARVWGPLRAWHALRRPWTMPEGAVAAWECNAARAFWSMRRGVIGHRRHQGPLSQQCCETLDAIHVLVL